MKIAKIDQFLVLAVSLGGDSSFFTRVYLWSVDSE